MAEEKRIYILPTVDTSEDDLAPLAETLRQRLPDWEVIIGPPPGSITVELRESIGGGDILLLVVGAFVGKAVDVMVDAGRAFLRDRHRPRRGRVQDADMSHRRDFHADDNHEEDDD